MLFVVLGWAVGGLFGCLGWFNLWGLVGLLVGCSVVVVCSICGSVDWAPLFPLLVQSVLPWVGSGYVEKTTDSSVGYNRGFTYIWELADELGELRP